MLHAGGQDEGGAGVGAVIRDYSLAGAVPDLQDFLQLQADPQGFRLIIQPVRQLRTGNGHETREVLHPGRGGDLPAEALLFQQQHGFTRPPGIDGGGKTRGAAAHDENVKMLHHSTFISGRDSGP